MAVLEECLKTFVLQDCTCSTGTVPQCFWEQWWLLLENRWFFASFRYTAIFQLRRLGSKVVQSCIESIFELYWQPVGGEQTGVDRMLDHCAPFIVEKVFVAVSQKKNPFDTLQSCCSSSIWFQTLIQSCLVTELGSKNNTTVANKSLHAYPSHQPSPHRKKIIPA